VRHATIQTYDTHKETKHMTMSTLESIRSSRKSAMDKLKGEVSKINNRERSYADDREWSLSVGKDGNGMAVIRFLPAPAGEDVPWVRVWRHSFRGPSGLWYIEDSLTTIGKTDPVGEMNSKLWNSTTDDESPARKQARAQKRKLTYVSNILVVKDTANPDNEGKVFLFKYGKKVFDKVMEKLEPAFEDEAPMNPFDPDLGANFRLKARNVEGYRNYDKSEFDKPSPIAESDEAMAAILTKCYSLQEFMNPSKFKSYDELKTKLDRVLGATPSSRDVTEDAPAVAAPRVAPAAEKKAAPAKKAGWEDDEEEGLDFFKKLAED